MTSLYKPFFSNSRNNIDFFLQVNRAFKIIFNLPMEKMGAFMDKFTAQTAVLNANLLVIAQTIP